MTCNQCGGKHDKHPRIPGSWGVTINKGTPIAVPIKYFVLDVSAYQGDMDIARIRAMGIKGTR